MKDIKSTLIDISQLENGVYFVNNGVLTMATKEETDTFGRVLLSEPDCKIVSCSPTLFEIQVTKLLKEGYEVSSSSCNSKDEWKAIMIR